MDTKEILNEIYESLVKRSKSICNSVQEKFSKVSYGFYNNHFYKNDAGEYISDCFPIPVVTIENLCDIEFDLDKIAITSKLRKQDVIGFEYNELSGMNFEIYGVDDYLKDYLTDAISLDEAITEISKSNETEFFYTFYFENDTDNNVLSEFLCFIDNNGFYY